jgi:hypothetical protein
MTASYVGVGTVVSAVNASLSPSAGPITVGDLALIVVSIRNSGAGTPDRPGGWLTLVDQSNLRVFGRFWQTGDTAPTITFTGGVALADTQAALISFRGIGKDQLTGAAVAALLNGSAQNINYGPLDVPGAGRAVIVVGWKQAISTAVSTPAGFSTSFYNNAAAGSGATLACRYQIQTTEADIAGSALTITGGAAAISRSIVIALRAAATLTASLVSTVYPPRVLLTATGLDIGQPITISRIVSGQRTAVRGADNTVMTATTLVIVDSEIPFGLPVSYVLTIGGSDDTTTTPVTYTLPGGKVVLSDAPGGLSAEVVIMSWPDQAQDAQASVFVVDRKNIVVTAGLAQYRSTVDLFTETTAGGDQLDRLLNAATSGIVQVRQPGGYDGVDGYWAVLGVSKTRWSQDGSDQRRIWSLSVAEVDPWPTSLLARGFTYADVVAHYTGLTYVQWAADYATYLAAQQGDYS